VAVGSRRDAVTGDGSCVCACEACALSRVACYRTDVCVCVCVMRVCVLRGVYATVGTSMLKYHESISCQHQ
jgi:hypothetical protein